MEAEEAEASEGLVEEVANPGWCLRSWAEEVEGRRSWVEKSQNRSWEAEVGGSLAGPLQRRPGEEEEEEVGGGLRQVEPECVWAQGRVSGNLWPLREEEEEGTLGQEAGEEGPPSEEEEEEHPEKETMARQQQRGGSGRGGTVV